jgi:hypothetical protein
MTEPIDYCTNWPDRLFGKDWSQCCLAHDIAYALPGSKLEADLDLGRCVLDATGWWWMAALMVAGVTVFGGSYWKSSKKEPKP